MKYFLKGLIIFIGLIIAAPFLIIGVAMYCIVAGIISTGAELFDLLQALGGKGVN